jgi:dTDP-4-dehydrorhamnose 3,5-epimerase
MKFSATRIAGVWRVQLEPKVDERGWFARTFCSDEFGRLGLNTVWPQTNLTRTHLRGMIRGLHWQAQPHPEIKLVRCAVGQIWDVVVDIRRASPTFGHWESFELDSISGDQIYIPAGVAHGFQCLEAGSEVAYQMSAPYHPSLARGLRWNDPQVEIAWPIPNPTLSERDQLLPFLSDAAE